MKIKKLYSIIWSVVTLAAFLSAGAIARADGPIHLKGVINGYSPASVTPTGPWEIRGTWTLTINPFTNTADFTADLTMERSDLWVLANMQNPDSTALRLSHTHHIALQNIPITTISKGFRLEGNATITKDGSPAPFSPAPLQVDFTGGTSLLISNVALTFLVPTSGNNATVHFGSVPILGVVASLGNPF